MRKWELGYNYQRRLRIFGRDLSDPYLVSSLAS
nr:MAG TPA: hypothetical protein [Caudoviricetes sp.]